MKPILLATLALACTTAAAMAEPARGPVPLDDDRLEQVQAGQTPLTLAVFKNVAVQMLKNVKINAELRTRPDVRGNLAEAEAGANARGTDTFSETLTLADVVQGQSSSSFSGSVAAASQGTPLGLR